MINTKSFFLGVFAFIIFILSISEFAPYADARFIDEMPEPIEVIDCE